MASFTSSLPTKRRIAANESQNEITKNSAKSQLVKEVPVQSFLDELPARLIGEPRFAWPHWFSRLLTRWNITSRTSSTWFGWDVSSCYVDISERKNPKRTDHSYQISTS